MIGSHLRPKSAAVGWLARGVRYPKLMPRLTAGLFLFAHADHALR